MLEITDLTKRYGPVVALDAATFTVRPGRLVGFLGPNGAGKTTTMRCIFGLTKPDGGSITWSGRPIDRAARLRFGYMPEQRGLYPRMKVADQLTYFAEQHGLAARDARSAATGWLETLGVADRAGSRLEALSHGNQQRVQLGAALVHDGRIVAAGPIDELRASSTRRHLEVEVVGDGNTWLAAHPELVVQETRGDLARLVAASDVDLTAILAAASAAGTVRRFAFQPPTLSELFL